MMTKAEARKIAVLTAIAAPYQLTADMLRDYARRPLEQGLADLSLAKLLADRRRSLRPIA